MSLPTQAHEGAAPDTPAPGKGLVIALGLLACSVIVHAVVTDWRPSPGGNPWLVPVIASGLILACALLLALRLRGHAAGSDDLAAARRRRGRNIAGAALFTGLWGLGFFHAVQELGLVSATFLFTAVGMLALSPDPRRALRVVLPLTLAVAISFWLMFTRLAPIVLSDPLLW